jgi:glutamate synthase domain-containing protein 2
MVKTIFLSLICFLLLSIYALSVDPRFWILVCIFGLLITIAIYDLTQSKHTLKRNFPLLGRTRYFMEDLRPKIYQYFIESDTNGKPFNRQQRSLVYQRAKLETDTNPFGTHLDVYESGYEWVSHSMHAIDARTLNENPRIRIGSPNCSQPYMASMLNISALSFGALSQNAILALNAGAKIGGFAHNTGEGGLSDYHLEPGGDIIWNIGTGYFSCRNQDGSFSAAEFEKRATLPNVKMIEIKFSQGAKPGHGGILPAKKLTPEIAKIRLVGLGEDVVSPPRHSAFDTPEEFVQFVHTLRTLSGGKPIGMKLCVGKKDEFIAICSAMVQSKIYLDFITVDGGEGGTGAAPLEFSNYVGMPLQEGIVFVYDTLKEFDLKKHIKIICSGKIVSGFDIIRALSLGADVCNSARGMMFALGCIQALECNTNTCPTGVATQDKSLMRGLVVEDKKTRVANFHKNTVKAAVEMMAAAGVKHPDEVNRDFISRRISINEVKTLLEIYPEPSCKI